MSFVKEQYEGWVQRNASWYLPLLETARVSTTGMITFMASSFLAAQSLTVFLPGRFSDTGIRSEASTWRCATKWFLLECFGVTVYATLNLVSTYHDAIMGRSVAFVIGREA